MASFQDNMVSWHKNAKPSWISLEQEMINEAAVTTQTLRWAMHQKNKALVKALPAICQHQIFYRSDALWGAQVKDARDLESNTQECEK